MSIKFKKARVRALLAALEDLESKFSSTEEEGPADGVAPAISDGHLSDVGRSSPIKAAQGTNKFISFCYLPTAWRMVDEPISSSSPSTSPSYNFGDLASQNAMLDDILRCDSYYDFIKFCSNVGIIVSSTMEAK